MGYGNGLYVSYITLIYYSEKGLAQANANDKKITEFFQNVKIWLRENDLKRDLKFTEADKALDQLLQSTKKPVHDSFCDNFNIPSALVALFELIKKTYDYANQAKDKLKIHLIYSVAHFLSFIFKSLGLVYNTEFIEYFKFETSEGKNSEEVLTPFIDATTTFRSKIKAAACVDKDIKKILQICDDFRDEVLPYLGVKIEDKGKDKPSIWKFYDKDQYIKEKEKQKEILENQKKQKEAEAKERELKLSTPAKEYYAMMTDKYSAFDEEGVPIKNAKGGDLSKEQINKLKKDFQKHQKNHLKWLEQQSKKKEKGEKGEKKKKEEDKKEEDKKE